MLGSALVRRLAAECGELLLTTRQQLDLTDQAAVRSWVEENQPELIFHAGAMVGGIYANSLLPADFLYNNLMIEGNVLEAAYRSGVTKLIFVASNCVYPTNAPRPIPETAVLTGPLENNIRFYAVSKIAGIELCRAYRKQYGCNFVSVIPPNLYGPGDNYHPKFGHVVSGILLRAHEAKLAGARELSVWGDGTPRRELLYVDDLADAMVHLMRVQVDHDVVNIGCGHDLTIAQIAQLIAETVGFEGSIVYDTTKPNGSAGKLLDSARINTLGWRPKVSESAGLRKSYEDFLRRPESAQIARRELAQ